MTAVGHDRTFSNVSREWLRDHAIEQEREIAKLQAEVDLWKSRWEAERQAHEATMHHADETFRELNQR